MKCINKLKGRLKGRIETLEKHCPFWGSTYYSIVLNDGTEIRLYLDWGLIGNVAKIIKGKEKVKIDIGELGLRKYIVDLIAKELERREEEEINGRNRKKLGELKRLGVC